MQARSKFPLGRLLKSKKTAEDLLIRLGKEPCVVYSEIKRGYYKDGGWVPVIETPGTMPFKDAYGMFKGNLGDGIVFIVL